MSGRHRSILQGLYHPSDGPVEVTLSADHRAIDGATGAELLREFKHFVENPEQIFG